MALRLQYPVYLLQDFPGALLAHEGREYGYRRFISTRARLFKLRSHDEVTFGL